MGITTGLVGAYFFYVKTKLLFLSRYSFSIRIVVITIAGGYMDIGYNLIEKIYGDVVKIVESFRLVGSHHKPCVRVCL
ncbi:MAG: hypothetical protein A3A85_04480 [Deltaproteobacteria bacterium RIFCSPLOWO2_01_FULL_42_9]|nr:MAG: hypothetical protein A3A85_04480 [Deltaproteobacteria bacterium RIFCSPLOWO2_01_FULL_42_9]